MATSTIKQSIQLSNPVLLRSIGYPTNTSEDDTNALLIANSDLNTYKFICLVYGTVDGYSKNQTLISSAFVKATGYAVTMLSGVANTGGFIQKYTICVNTAYIDGAVYIKRVYVGEYQDAMIYVYGLN